ncbi:PD40 domain-containing protein [Nitrosococcus watsonii]|uniref:Hydrazine synthase alpha subunit middle domain-containing protein n=1 Tax=Nitrosococcus watsoni (strain C-113) TaxID=105559 RepID=D8K6V8_NITWC|nr:PD40 domain-containing protein [Nitrosococcus watsonii]ADJ28635.1 conserved hypothetical protein [Nitrosococcus watsonii C-113]
MLIFNYRIMVCVLLGMLQGADPIAASGDMDSQEISPLRVAASSSISLEGSGEWLPEARQRLFGAQGSGTLRRLPGTGNASDGGELVRDEQLRPELEDQGSRTVRRLPETGNASDSGERYQKWEGVAGDSPKDGIPQPKPEDVWNMDEGIVYTRIPRTTSTIEANGKILRNLDNYDRLSDVTARFWGFSAPGQLVYRKADGNEEILYDCVSPEPRPCVPMDVSVSLDGTRIAFTIYRAARLYNQQPNTFPMKLPNKSLAMEGAEAQIVTLDLITGKLTAWPHTSGTWDTAPIWLPDGRIMFASTRAGDWPSVLGSAGFHPALQLWIAKADGSEAVRVGPHERDNAMHPWLHSKTGRVMYSSWQIVDMLPYRSRGGLQVLFGTKDNFWWVMSVDQRGGNLEAELGAHTRQASIEHGLHTLKALHFLGERANGDMCTANYYRGNNLGGGTILCWPVEPGNVEGESPAYAPSQKATFEPRGLYLAIAGGSTDMPADKKGRARDPEGLPDGNLLFTWMEGRCHRSGYLYFKKDETQKPELGCNTGIYRTTRIPANPATETDTLVVVDSPDWHEFMPRLVRSRQVATPPLKTTDSGQCLLGGASMEAEVRNYGGEGEFPDRTPCALQGCSTHGIDLSEMVKIRFWEVIPFKRRRHESDFNGSQGIRTRVLGDVPLQEDGSFLASLPCDMPYLMAGVDSEGRAIARDQVVQSLRPGELHTCGGCHLHSTNQTPKFEESLAAQNSPVILEQSSVPEWKWAQDVFPLLQKNCASCHSGDEAPDGLTLDRPGTGKGSTYWQLANNINTQHLPEPPPVDIRGASPPGRMDRPWLSKYVHMLFARESLLYWKAAGQRLDGRTDEDRPNDINFGPDHPWTLNEAELKILADWIESGVYAE